MSYHIWEAYFVCNIVINIYATVAIICLIARIASESFNRSDRLHRTWRIIAESGALYTLSTVVNLIATILGGKGYRLFRLIADPINFSMAGVAFNLILIRLGQQRQQRLMDKDVSSDLQPDNNRIGQHLSVMQFCTKATDSTLSQDSYALHPRTNLTLAKAPNI
ncbi:hypothetical protein AX15_001069 [Amanita polypyramis BW_CC]|nr:hypothetical protein AX15_001069 [Amanita polypyramis BW_CC]